MGGGYGQGGMGGGGYGQSSMGFGGQSGMGGMGGMGNSSGNQGYNSPSPSMDDSSSKFKYVILFCSSLFTRNQYGASSKQETNSF